MYEQTGLQFLSHMWWMTNLPSYVQLSHWPLCPTQAITKVSITIQPPYRQPNRHHTTRLPTPPGIFDAPAPHSPHTRRSRPRAPCGMKQRVGRPTTEHWPFARHNLEEGCASLDLAHGVDDARRPAYDPVPPSPTTHHHQPSTHRTTLHTHTPLHTSHPLHRRVTSP